MCIICIIPTTPILFSRVLISLIYVLSCCAASLHHLTHTLSTHPYFTPILDPYTYMYVYIALTLTFPLLRSYTHNAPLSLSLHLCITATMLYHPCVRCSSTAFISFVHVCAHEELKSGVRTVVSLLVREIQHFHE